MARRGDLNWTLKFYPRLRRFSVMFQDGDIHKKGDIRDEKELQTLIAWLRQ